MMLTTGVGTGGGGGGGGGKRPTFWTSYIVLRNFSLLSSSHTLTSLTSGPTQNVLDTSSIDTTCTKMHTLIHM